MEVNISDANGRALEYAIVNALIKHSHCECFGCTSADQKRDKIKFEGLSISQQSFYESCAMEIIHWLEERFAQYGGITSIERFSDSVATAGDVTDIRVVFGAFPVNLSIKHNHDALKHQRPPTTAQRCGYAPGSPEDVEFRTKLDSIFLEFLKNAKKLDPKALYFRELKEKKKDFIDTRLYYPICKHVTETIKKLCVKPQNVKVLFRFLVGNTDFYKIVVRHGVITIFRFAEIPEPKSITVTQPSNSYVYLEFSNKWIISMRLHTASSRLGTSVKFDTQPLNLEQVLPVEKLLNNL